MYSIQREGGAKNNATDTSLATPRSSRCQGCTVGGSINIHGWNSGLSSSDHQSRCELHRSGSRAREAQLRHDIHHTGRIQSGTECLLIGLRLEKVELGMAQTAGRDPVDIALATRCAKSIHSHLNILTLAGCGEALREAGDFRQDIGTSL